MGGFIGIMASLAVTLPGRVLMSLGIGVLSFAGITAIINQIIAEIQSIWTGLGADIASLAALAGLNVCFGIILGAVVVRVTFMAIPKLGVLS